MHRFILKKVFTLCCIYTGLAYAGPFSASEQSWIDAHPVVRFSIHEKYAPYLNLSSKEQGAAPFMALLSKMEECTRQQYVPVWRKSDQEGLKQLGKGEVDFIIDPPDINKHVLKFGSLSDPIFGGRMPSLPRSQMGWIRLMPRLAILIEALKIRPLALMAIVKANKHNLLLA